MLATVRMHPLLVTHSRDQEKAAARHDAYNLTNIVVSLLKHTKIIQFQIQEDGGARHRGRVLALLADGTGRRKSNLLRNLRVPTNL